MKHPPGQPRFYDVRLAGQETAKRVRFDGAPQEFSF